MDLANLAKGWLQNWEKTDIPHCYPQCIRSFKLFTNLYRYALHMFEPKSVTIKHTHHVRTCPLLSLNMSLFDRVALIGDTVALIGALVGLWFCPTFAADKRHPGGLHKGWWKSMDQAHSGSNVINPDSLLQRWNV